MLNSDGFMGFFSDIIRDSHRTHSTFTLAGEAPMGSAQRLYLPERSPATDEGRGSARLTVENAPTRRIREESAGFSEAAWQNQMQAETVVRQVVSPSPAQHIPAGELAQVRENKEVTPNPETRKQTGSESDETATEASRMTRTESLRGDGSFEAAVVQASASDSSIRESSSVSAMSRAGTTAVETQGRQQAGETRAGLATPPGHTRPQNEPERPGRSPGEPVMRGLHGPTSPARQENADARTKENSALEKSAASPPLRADTSVDQSFASAADSHQKAPSTVRVTNAPADKTSQPEPSWRSRTQRDAFTAHRDDREKPSSGQAQRAAEPQVQIGTIEVVVLAQELPEQSSPSQKLVQLDPASRHYLRNF